MATNELILKQSIYSHQLFPLLQILFEKCELATVSDNAEFNCNEDLQVVKSQLLQHEQQQRYNIQQTTELDTLLLQYIQVLYIHLLELEKVYQLCDHFCQRYVHCLKGKVVLPVAVIVGGDGEEEVVVVQEPPLQETPPQETMTSFDKLDCNNQSEHCNDVDNNGYELNNSSVNNNYHDNDGKDDIITSVPASQLAVCPTSVPASQMAVCRTTSALATTSPAPSDQLIETSPKATRSTFTRESTQILRSWLFQHLTHPYPSEEQKLDLARLTNLSILQVNNWFINARRRIVQPLIDQSNRAAGVGSSVN